MLYSKLQARNPTRQPSIVEFLSYVSTPLNMSFVSWPARVAVITVFLFLRVAFFVYEIPSGVLLRGKFGRIKNILLITILLCGAFLVVIAVSFKNPSTTDVSSSQCDANIDADIGGLGVRVSIIIQAACLFLQNIVGLAIKSPVGAKELGAGLLLTHSALAIAIMVQLGRHTLSPVDGIISAIILDAQNAALSVQCSFKETLAARWQIVLVTMGQIVGLSFVGTIVSQVCFSIDSIVKEAYTDARLQLERLLRATAAALLSSGGAGSVTVQTHHRGQLHFGFITPCDGSALHM